MNLKPWQNTPVDEFDRQVFERDAIISELKQTLVDAKQELSDTQSKLRISIDRKITMHNKMKEQLKAKDRYISDLELLIVKQAMGLHR